MIKKVKNFLKKPEAKPFDYGAVTEVHLAKYYSNEEPHPYKRMLKYAFKHKKLFIPAFSMTIFFTIINILPPFFGQMAIALTGGKSTQLFDKLPFLKSLKSLNTKDILNNFINFDNGFDPVIILQFAGVIIVGLIYVVLRVGTDYVKSFLFSFCAQNIGRDVKTDMLKGLLNTDIGYFKQEQEGTLMSRVINESGSIESFISGTLPNLITVPLTIILTLCVLFLLNVKLTLVCLIAAPLLSLGITGISKLIGTRVTAQQNLLGNMTSVMQENIRGVEVIKIFSREDREIKRYWDASTEFINLMRKMQMTMALSRPMVELVMIIAMLLILAYGGFLVFKGEMPFEFLWGFLLYMLNISTPVRDLSGILVSLKFTKGVARRVFQIMDLPKENIDDPTKKKFEGIKNNVIFENVEFSYPKINKDVEAFKLGPVNLTVNRGDIVAFVGNSGGGKTTLVNLIPKLFLPQSGSIKFDNININDLNTRSLRERIGVVSQENILFYGTVRDNILFGVDNATDEDIEKVAKIAHAHDFILKLPKGYNTHIGPRGVMLSGGQRQRLALARAVLRKPDILILDEATSALDTESEMYVQKALNGIIRLQTTFVIAHRLSTIKTANKIFVVENGNIIESGTHEDLIKKGGKYQYLYSLQFRE